MATTEGAAPLRTTCVPVPSRFVDELLPTLKDTELRLLLVVLRQTWGRDQRGAGGPASKADWLSHRQLQQRTGRASEALSAAIDVLVRRGLLVVTNEAGLSLNTPEARQAVRSRLYFSPGPALIALRDSGKLPAETSDKWQTEKPKTTNRGIDYSHFRKSDPLGHAVSKIEEPSAQTGLDDMATAERVEQIKVAIRERLASLTH